MIPKIIHVFWFGNGKKSDLIKKCEESWNKYLKDYKIIEWNENNWDVNKYKYSKQAYEQGKWAFVSDCCRMDVLYEHGGVSIDADVEFLKPIPEDMLSQKGFTSKESSGRWISATMAAEKGHIWTKEVLKFYANNDFEYDPSKITNTVILDEINKLWYDRTEGENIILNGEFVIYPRTILECKNWSTGEIETCEDSVAIHHYSGSWL
jgi:mannosyltransferase OCH1-like enzyme